MKTIISPKNDSIGAKLKELLSYRELIQLLAYRDFKVRYAQTFLGFLWVLIQPLLTLLIFILVFDKALKINTLDVPYPVFMMSGMITWSLFSYILNQSGNSLIASQALVTKVYFPRLCIPISKALVGLIDFAVTLLITFVFMFAYDISVSSNIVFLPIFLLMSVLFSLSVGILFSALSIRFRDFQYLIPFLVQIGLYITPIAYPTSLVPDNYKILYYLNPMAVIIDGCRFSLLNTPLPDIQFLSMSILMILLISIFSVILFFKVEDKIADLI